MIFYGLKTCDTCRKAQKQLIAAGHEFTVVDVRADGVDAQTITTWVDAHDWKTVLNTRSTTWRNLEAADKENIDAAKAITLMSNHPTLIKRPVIEAGGQVFVGWRKETQAAFL